MMIKRLLFIPAIAAMLFAFGCTNTSKEAQDAVDKQTEEIEKSIQDLDEVIDSANVEVEKLQGEIDELLNDI
jgi:peptidoglycan hydrolase CwlO-like protein